MMRVGVVGAGLPGLGMAFHLARQGYAVTVLDKAAPGQGASAAAIGSLSPYRPHEVHTLANAQLQSLAQMPDFMAAAAEVSGLLHGHSIPGRLQIIDSHYLPFALQPFLDKANNRWGELAQGVATELLTADEVTHRWGRFFKNADVFVHDKVSQQIHPPTAIACFIAALTKLGGVIEQAEVHEVKDAGSHVTLSTSAGERVFDRVIVCAGMGMNDIQREQAPVLPVEPHYGEGFAVQGFLPFGAPGLLAGKRYVHHWADGTAYVGSTTRTTNIQPPPYEAGAAEITKSLSHFLSDAGVLKPLRIWSAARPTRPDQRPFVGALSERIFAVGGLYKVGFSLMAYAAHEAGKFLRDEALAPPLGMNSR